MNRPISLFLVFAWLAILGIGFTLLDQFLIPILIAAAVFTALVLMLIPKRN